MRAKDAPGDARRRRHRRPGRRRAGARRRARAAGAPGRARRPRAPASRRCTSSRGRPSTAPRPATSRRGARPTTRGRTCCSPSTGTTSAPGWAGRCGSAAAVLEVTRTPKHCLGRVRRRAPSRRGPRRRPRPARLTCRRAAQPCRIPGARCLLAGCGRSPAHPTHRRPGARSPTERRGAPPESFTLVATGDVLIHQDRALDSRARAQDDGGYDFSAVLAPVRPADRRRGPGDLPPGDPGRAAGRSVPRLSELRRPARDRRRAGRRRVRPVLHRLQPLPGRRDRGAGPHARRARRGRDRAHRHLPERGGEPSSRGSSRRAACGSGTSPRPSASTACRCRPAGSGRWTSPTCPTSRRCWRPRPGPGPPARRSSSRACTAAWSTSTTRPSAQVAAVRALLASPDIDLVLGHHAHVVQPFEQIAGEWAAYGLGNHIAEHATRGYPDRGLGAGPLHLHPRRRTAGSPSPPPRRSRCAIELGADAVRVVPADPATFDRVAEVLGSGGGRGRRAATSSRADRGAHIRLKSACHRRRPPTVRSSSCRPRPPRPPSPRSGCRPGRRRCRRSRTPACR